LWDKHGRSERGALGQPLNYISQGRIKAAPFVFRIAAIKILHHRDDCDVGDREGIIQAKARWRNSCCQIAHTSPNLPRLAVHPSRDLLLHIPHPLKNMQDEGISHAVPDDLKTAGGKAHIKIIGIERRIQILATSNFRM